MVLSRWAQNWPDSVNLGRIMSQVGRTRPQLGRIRSKFGRPPLLRNALQHVYGTAKTQTTDSGAQILSMPMKPLPMGGCGGHNQRVGKSLGERANFLRARARYRIGGALDSFGPRRLESERGRFLGIARMASGVANLHRDNHMAPLWVHTDRKNAKQV